MPTLITLDLIRKCAEHNNCEISTLEELSLHQRDVLKIDLLDNVCRKLKILYLQNNLIGKIENVGRLKELVYLNLALNSVLVLEGLTGCEMLEKLDLTVNFIGDLTGVKSLRVNRNLKILYMTGNPCASFERYREYVVATLPQLEKLDGIDITKSERIVAMQDFEETERSVIAQCSTYAEKQAAKAAKKEAARAAKENKAAANPGFDGNWYCDTQNTAKSRGKRASKPEPKIVEILTDDETSSESEIDDEEAREFWQEESEYDPESRMEAAIMAEKQQRQKDKVAGNNVPKKKKKRRRQYFRADGKALNINDGGWDFELSGQLEDDKPYVLDLACYRHLETSAIDLDVQPHHVRVNIQGKVFQLNLLEEVSPDAGKAERSKITGRLLVTMPKVAQLLKPLSTAPKKVERLRPSKTAEAARKRAANGRERLEVGEGVAPKVTDHTTIVADNEAKRAQHVLTKPGRTASAGPRPNDPDFVDDDDVPPLE